MSFLREFAVFVAVIFVVYIPWMFLVHALLRICGLPIKIWPGKGRSSINEVVLRTLGKQKFVLIEGVLLWGWPCFAAIEIYDYIAHKYLGAPFRNLGPGFLLMGLLIWSASGYCFGLWMWSKSSRWGFELDS